MKSILIKRTKYGYISETLENDSNYKLEILADWLLDDVRNHSDSWIEWLNNDNYEDTDSNATWLEKEITPQCDQEIIFGSLAHMINNTKKGVYKVLEGDILRISKERVIELLNSWEQLLKTRPKQIMITEEDGIYKMFEIQ